MMTVEILHSQNPARENLVCMRPVDVPGQIFSDQTGRLLRVSIRGNISVMVLYDCDSNVILTEPLKNNTASDLVRAQTRLAHYLLDHGLKPTALYIDNKCPKALKRFPRANSIDFQLCPPNEHHNNQAEKSMNTWKCHFLTGISGVDPNFSLHLWCRLLHRATQTLNLLHRSRINP